MIEVMTNLINSYKINDHGKANMYKIIVLVTVGRAVVDELILKVGVDPVTVARVVPCVTIVVVDDGV
jgi:hypothetical protein